MNSVTSTTSWSTPILRYRSCFVEWLRLNGSKKKEVSADLFGKLVELHANRKRGTSLDTIVEQVYPLPLSSADPEVETLESRFLAWLASGR